MDKTNFSAKADSLLQQADKKLKGGFWKNLSSSKQDRMDEAKELYQNAANCYKLAQNWEQAVSCYIRCAECEEEEGDTAQHYREAARCMKKINTFNIFFKKQELQEQAHVLVELFYLETAKFSDRAIQAYCLNQQISSAASLAKECAEKLDEDHDYEEAIKYYEKMAELYLTEEQPTSANQALMKVADLIVLTRDYSQLPKAIKNYDRVGNKYLSTPLVKTNAKDVFFRACLCHLANEDLVGAKKAIQTYKIDDPNFDGSRENELLDEMLNAIESSDEALFIKKVGQFTKMTVFDKVKNQLVAKIKEIYLPDEQSLGGAINKFSKLDFTGAADDDDNNKQTNKREDLGGKDKTKKKPQLDFT